MWQFVPAVWTGVGVGDAPPRAVAGGPGRRQRARPGGPLLHFILWDRPLPPISRVPALIVPLLRAHARHLRPTLRRDLQSAGQDDTGFRRRCSASRCRQFTWAARRRCRRPARWRTASPCCSTSCCLRATPRASPRNMAGNNDAGAVRGAEDRPIVSMSPGGCLEAGGGSTGRTGAHNVCLRCGAHCGGWGNH